MAAVVPVYNGAATITPAPTKTALTNNYIDFTSAGTNSANWAQQYLPELMEKEAEVYGNRTISGFLAQVGAEESMTSDQVVWSEQGRLHLTQKATAATVLATCVIDFGGAHPFKVNDTVMVHGVSGGNATGVGKTLKCLVTDTGTANKITAIPYTQAAFTGTFNAATHLQVLKYGTEVAKGKDYDREAITPGFKSHTNKPIILRDKYQINGSDTAQIGWVEVSGEDGQSGYMWYIKAEAETRSRFADYLEMAMIEGELVSGTQLDALAGMGTTGADGIGTEGLFAAIRTRGNVLNAGMTTTAANNLLTFDEILKKFDAQGAIEENMLFLNRDYSLKFDDMLAAVGGSAGSGFGLFNNSSDMALNLGFTGFRRGSYDFYKSDWKYLNDAAGRGGFGDISGLLVPAGTSSVYDQNLGKNIKRPFLHVRYRASQTDDRRMKTWVTGSVGAATSALDAMQLHFLTERCLITQGANNFMLMK